MKVINVGDWIYAVRTDTQTGAVIVDQAVVLTVGAVQVKIEACLEAFRYRRTFKRDDVFTSSREALLAYREKTVQLLLIMGRGLAKGHVTLESIDEQLEVRGE